MNHICPYSTAHCSQGFVVDKAFPWNDILMVHERDLHHCQLACTQNPGCSYFSYVVKEYHLFEYLVCTTGNILLLPSCTVSLSDGLCGEIQYVLVTGCVRDLLDEVHFLGNNIANQPFTTENASQCRQECTKNDICQYFTFVDENAGIIVHRYRYTNYIFFYAWANKGSKIIFESCITIVYPFVLSLTKSALLVISFCCLVYLYPVSLSDGLCGEIQYVLVTGCVRDLLDKVHFLGNNIANQPFTTENASQCRQECTKNDTCQYFTFVDENAGIIVHRYTNYNFFMLGKIKAHLQHATSGYSLRNCSGKGEYIQ
uniref:Apple domain-containing protein n=1 Tax=Oncorhynchus kisutch TaxID=8019 RepID=A0A8C7IRC6_ONCKI